MADDDTAELPAVTVDLAPSVADVDPPGEPDVEPDAEAPVEPDVVVPEAPAEPDVVVPEAPAEPDAEPEAPAGPDVAEAPAEPDVAEAPAEPDLAEAPAAAAGPVVASHAAPRRRRRWPWVVLGSLVAALVVVGAAVVWYVSGLIGAGAAVPQPDSGFPMTVTSVEGTALAYRGVPEGWTDEGLTAIASIEGGYVQTSDPVTAGVGPRTVSAVVLGPPIEAGQAVTLDDGYFPRDPRVGLGLAYEDVSYESPLGPMPAWFIPGTSRTWVVVVHGRSDSPVQGLRLASTVAPLGYPMLLIKYRNDAGTPAGNGYGQFGADEWQDVEAGVRYAMDHGADTVVLAGFGMGGSAALAFLQNSELSDEVVGVFLDAPATDYGAIVEHQAAAMGLPSFVTGLAKSVASWRFGLDWEAIDYVADAGSFDTPMVVVQGTDDAVVPAALNEEFAAAAGADRATIELFEGAGHTASWNADRPRYEQVLTAFLNRVAPVT